VLSKMDEFSPKGTSIMHEFSECYNGAIDALKRKRSFTPSFCRGSNYKKAHKKATPQANLQYYEVDINGNRTRDKKNAVGQKIFVTDGIRTSTVIDWNYAEDGKIE
jgi:hypothetical protein